MIDATMFSDEIQNVLKPLYRISYGILCSHTEAEDAIQQVLLKAWSSRGKVNLDKF